MPTPHKSGTPAIREELLPVECFEIFIARGELRVPRHIATGKFLHFAMRLPPAEVEWVLASGRATLSSFTVMWKAYREGMQVPYNVAWVELEEGPRLISNVLHEPPENLRIGMKLQAKFHDGLVVFSPLPSETTAS
ncbi:MAG: OB-fold domain-containing protein [Pseudomonadota bacterium]